jgi:uncharacterized protein (TIGR03437 family)
MFNRFFCPAARFCLLAVLFITVSITATAQQPNGILFQLPGANVSGSRFFGFAADANPFSPFVDKSGPLSASQVLVTPNGSKFYFIGSGTGGVQSIDNTFGTFRSVNGILGTVTAAAVTPDGKYLLVGGQDLYIVDTSTDTVLANTANVTGSIGGFAVSRDSKTAWILTNSAFGSSIVSVNLINRQRLYSDAYSLPFGGATSITLSPLGFLYVAEVNRVYEVDPVTLNQSANGTTCIGLPRPCVEIQLVATPGPLHFTPDGTTAYFVNLTPSTGGQSILKLTIAGHNISTWPPFTGTSPPLFDDCFVAGNGRVFAYSSSTTTLWDITPSPLGGVVSQLSAVVPVQNVLAVAISNELPSAKYLYLLLANGNQTNIARIDLGTNTVSIQAQDILNSGIFQFVGIPPQSGASSFIVYNSLQVVKSGTTPLPLIARVLDSAGRPLNNIAVSFQTDAGNGVTINTPSQATNGDGYVQTTVTLPTVPGTYTITLTAGGATTTYNLTVPGASGGGGPPGTIQQVTIVKGDGQMVQAYPTQSSTLLGGQPLTLKVTDQSGAPLKNVPVAFSITSGVGNIINTSFGTDENGIATTDFAATASPTFGLSFASVTVNASTDVGSVDFNVVVYTLPQDGSAQPQVDILSPPVESGFIITAGQGQAVTDAIKAAIHSSYISVNPIPGVGIRIADGFDTTMDGPATCQGSTLSDNNGVAHCTLVAACKIGTYGFYISVGEYKFYPAVLNIVKGQASALAISQGNNQSGKAGDTLPQQLIATVSDPCGGQVLGVTGTWSVVSGSATLKNASSTSDSAGRFTTSVVLGSSPGPIQIKLVVANIGQVIFTLTNQVVVTGVTLVSGGGQTGFTSAAFPQPVVFQVKDAQGNPVPGIDVTFNVVAGSGSVNPPTLKTDAQGRVATTVTAGTTAGNITISATAGGQSAQATLTSKPPGLPLTPSSFFNAANDSVTGQKALGLVPCGIASAQGNGLAPGISPGSSVSGATLFGPLQTTLNGVSLTVNGILAPIFSLSNINGVQQVNFQTPCETPVGAATVVVQVNGSTTTVSGVTVLQAQPGIFNYDGGAGKSYGAVYRALDGSPVTRASMAHRGEKYYMFTTGLGQVTPPTSTNSSGTGTQKVPSTVIVGVNNSGVPTDPATYAVGYVGVYLVFFTIPADFPTGTDLPLAVQIVINGAGVFGNQTFLPGVN